jgi:hypothetical protein
MPSIKDLRQLMLELLKKEYDKAKAPSPAHDDAIEKAFYVRKQDAAAIRGACKSGSLTVSFRDAGRHTLARIAAGNPCKGHIILDKSIKEKGGGYTYAIAKDVFERYQGLVGVPDSPGGTKLVGIWVVEEGHPVKKELAHMTEADVAKGFTGDYDMHDLVKKGARVFSGTPDEESAIEALNDAMLKADPERSKKVHAEKASHTRDSNYALIRHGAQTSYISYLLGAGRSEIAKVTVKDGMIPDQEKIANISADICVFTATGEAYLCTGVGSVYKFYEANHLLDQMPLYFFFKDLSAKHQKELAPYAEWISKYLMMKKE